jgi:hypothetical protein
MNDHIDDDFDDDGFRPPRPINEIEYHELIDGLCSLTMFGDIYMRMQGNNLAIVDQFIMPIEQQVAKRLFDEERTPIDDVMFLNAQSQMWIFSLYEILRAWRQNAKNTIKWYQNNVLEQKISQYREQDGTYLHRGRLRRAEQLEVVLKNPDIVASLQDDMKRLHMPYSQIDFLRVSLAKHEEKGKLNSVANSPGYARIDRMTGSMTYELGSGRVVLGYITRREIADSIRALPSLPVPDNAAIKSFDEFMKADFGDLEVDEI